MDASALSPVDRDLAIRTILGEARGQGDIGQAAVAHVILNRVYHGGYGGTTASDVVLAKNQFEPWSTRRSELLSYAPDSADYHRAGAILDAASRGEIPDITDGATNFLNKKTVQARGTYRNPNGLPDWAQGEGQDIGDHTFYKPKGAVRRAAPAGQGETSWDDVMRDAGGNAPGGMSAPVRPKPEVSADDLWNEILSGAKGNAARAETVPTGRAGFVATKDGMRDGRTGELVVAGKPFTDNSSTWSGLTNFSVSAIPVLGHPAAAAAAAGYETLFGSGGSFGDNYAQANAILNAARDRYAEENPKTNLLTGIAGTAVGLAPALATGPGAAALGATGETLAGRAAMGGISGAILGAADAGARGLSGEDVAKGAAYGSLGGALGPAVGKVLGAGTNALVNAAGERAVSLAPGVSGSAGRVLNSLVRADGPDAVRNRLMELGGQGMLAEAGPSLEGAAAGLIPKPGDAKSILVNAVRERSGSANARLNADVRAAIGPAEDPVAVTANIRAARSRIDGENYPAALDAAPAIDAGRVVALIDRQLRTAEGQQRRALTGLRDMLYEAPEGGGEGVLKTNAEQLHNIKGELDSVINYDAPGLGVPAGAVSRSNASLVAARREINGALERQVPGYAEANAASAALARRVEAVEAGTNILGSGKTTLTPDGLAEVLNGMSPGERIALAKGTRGEIERQLGVKINDLTALKTALQGEGGWNTAKLEQVFGAEGTNRLVAAVAREAEFANTTNKLLHNSMTANRLGGAKFIEDQTGVGTDLRGMTLPGLALHYGKKLTFDPVWNLLTKTDNSQRDAEIARVLTAIGPERDLYVNALTGRATQLMKTNKLADFLASRAETGTNALMLAAGPTYARSR